jgi:hypothetical protein
MDFVSVRTDEVNEKTVSLLERGHYPRAALLRRRIFLRARSLGMPLKALVWYPANVGTPIFVLPSARHDRKLWPTSLDNGELEVVAAWILAFLFAVVGLSLLELRDRTARDGLVVPGWRMAPVTRNDERKDAKCGHAIEACSHRLAEHGSTETVSD